MLWKSRQHVEAVPRLHVTFEQNRIQALAGRESIGNRKTRLDVQVRSDVTKWTVEVDKSGSSLRAFGNRARQVDRYCCRTRSMFRGCDAVNLSALYPLYLSRES